MMIAAVLHAIVEESGVHIQSNSHFRRQQRCDVSLIGVVQTSGKTMKFVALGFNRGRGL
jgi:hypothetical protein